MVDMRDASIFRLNQVQSKVAGGMPLDAEAESLVKETFRNILESGDTYDVKDVENWLVKGLCMDSPTCERIMNIAHYQKTKYEARNKLRMVSEGDKCGCGGSH